MSVCTVHVYVCVCKCVGLCVCWQWQSQRAYVNPLQSIRGWEPRATLPDFSSHLHLRSFLSSLLIPPTQTFLPLVLSFLCWAVTAPESGTFIQSVTCHCLPIAFCCSSRMRREGVGGGTGVKKVRWRLTCWVMTKDMKRVTVTQSKRKCYLRLHLHFTLLTFSWRYSVDWHTVNAAEKSAITLCPHDTLPQVSHTPKVIISSGCNKSQGSKGYHHELSLNCRNV